MSNPLKKIEAYIFDCDGTLSSIEGITELARLNGCEDQVGALTEMAMSQQGITPELYAQRLELVKPTMTQCQHIGDLYIQSITPDIKSVIQALQSLNKSIYIISAGIQSSVCMLANFLDINQENVFAVELHYNDQGVYHSFRQDSPLVQPKGKEKIAKQLLEQHCSLCAIGDGANDLPLQSVCTQFIGYGGAFYRPKIRSACDHYISSSSMAPLLYLSLQQDEREHLSKDHQQLYDLGKAMYLS